MRPALATERRDSSYGMGVTYSATYQSAPLDPARTVAEQDCTKPITLDRGNLLRR